ncbi:MAG TPA: RsmE family RNA methyltransferase [Polyangiaceae bacterium]|nr:RsmE family RNA methyltransferase [Polyangiaceae bacterium]
MSKPLRVPFDDLTPGLRPLAAALARYVTRVHRLRIGDRLALFDPAASTEADAELVDGPAPDVWCRVEALRPSGYRALPIRLIQGLGKADKPDEVIRAATALGAARVTLVHTDRSVARLPGERAAGRLERWHRIAVEAARQCGRGNIPELDGPRELGEVLPGEGAALRLMLAPDAEPLFERLAAWDTSRQVELLIGPEGGFDDAERSAAVAAGFLPASLGVTTLRTELAAVAALGALVALSAVRSRARS